MIKTTIRLEDSVVAKIVDGLRTGAYEITHSKKDVDAIGDFFFTETITVGIVVGGFKVEIEGERTRPSK